MDTLGICMYYVYTFKLLHTPLYYIRATIPMYSFTGEGQEYNPKQVSFIAERDTDVEVIKVINLERQTSCFYLATKDGDTQKDMDLYHYDVFMAYYSSNKKEVYIAGCVLCYKDDGDCVTGYILKKILRSL